MFKILYVLLVKLKPNSVFLFVKHFIWAIRLVYAKQPFDVSLQDFIRSPEAPEDAVLK